MSYKKLTFLFTQIVLYKLHYGSKLYTEVVDRTKMINLYALELLDEVRKNYSRIVCASVFQYAFSEFRIKESFSVELTKLYRWAVAVCEMFRFSSFRSGRI